MKRIKMFLIGFFCLVVCGANAQLPWELPVKKGMWDYPVKPGMEEWKQFQSYDEMVRACQIPEDLLSTLSTEDLTDLCLRYPPLWNFYAFENTNAGLDKLFSDFNGIRELFKRKDAASNLSRRYMEKIQTFPILMNSSNSDLEKGLFNISVSVLEGLLSRIEQQNNEDKDSQKEVLKALVAGYEEKLKYADNFNGFGFRTNFYARAHIISKMESAFVERLPQKNKNAALYSGMVDEQTVNEINKLSYQLTK
jgi:hypothetical protein